MEKITEIFVILENRPSTLGDLCMHMAENDINIDAIGVFVDTAKLYVKNVKKAMKVLNKLNYVTEMREVLRIDMENYPGALAEVASKFGNKGINIDFCYGTMVNRGNAVSVIMDVSDIDRAMKILEE